MSKTTCPTIDHDFVVRVATLVVARLRAMSATERTTVSSRTPSVLSTKIISASVVGNHPQGTPLLVRSDAIITPLAKDTAADRKITLLKDTPSS